MFHRFESMKMKYYAGQTTFLSFVWFPQGLRVCRTLPLAFVWGLS